MASGGGDGGDDDDARLAVKVGAVCIMSGFGQYPASQQAVVGLNLANSTQSFSHVGCVHDQKEEHLVLHSWCAT